MAKNKKNKKTRKNRKHRISFKVFITLVSLIIAILVGTCLYSYIKYQDPWYFFRPLIEEEQNDEKPNDNNNEQYENNAVVPGKTAADAKGNVVPNTYYAVISKEAYYKDIQDTMQNGTAENILVELTQLLQETHKTTVSYGEARYMLQYTDEDVVHKGTLIGMYDGTELEHTWDGKSWTREHVWPCSKMRIPPNDGDNYRPTNSTRDHRSDLHNLRSIVQSTNSSRSDRYYDNEPLTEDTYFPNVGEGDFRGDAARILFYMTTRYPDLTLVEEPEKAGTEMGKLSLLLQWNKEDPVDEYEIQRNNRISQYQGNRNPYIDYPNLADKIFS